MRLRLLGLDESIEDVDLPIGFMTRGKRLSRRNPWPVDYIGRSGLLGETGTLIPGKWQIVGELHDADGGNRLIVEQVS